MPLNPMPVKEIPYSREHRWRQRIAVLFSVIVFIVGSPPFGLGHLILWGNRHRSEYVVVGLTAAARVASDRSASQLQIAG
jgi:hypothetical protein